MKMLSIAACLLLAGAASAQPAGDPPPQRMKMQERFDAANTTHDGKLTLAQAQQGHMKRIADHFDDIDTAKKGYVTLDDIKAWARAQRHQHDEK
jgi:hypothetical protein